MKNRHAIPLILYAGLMILLDSGCSKNASVNSNNKALPENKLLSKVFVNQKLTSEIQYSEAKIIKSINQYEEGQFEGSETWEYDSDGMLSQKWFVDANGDFQVVWAYEYSDDGKLSRWLVYKNLFDDPTYGSSFEYDAEGRLAARYYYSPDEPDKIHSYITQDYDSYGNLLAIKGYMIQEDASVYQYLEQNFQYQEPKRIASIRKALGDYLSMNLMQLNSSTTYHNYDANGALISAYKTKTKLEFSDDGLPATSNIEVEQIVPQAPTKTATVSYEYIEF
ncbi:hypothetical protein GCM10027051_25550 [Niabella terrae]